MIPDMHKADASSIAYSGEAKVLKDYLFHHIEEGEAEIIAKVRELMPAAELKALGEKMMARKKELLAETA